MKDLAPAPIPAQLRAFTPARVALGRTGVSQQTRDVLSFQLSHALARDAVHAEIDAPALVASIAALVPDTPVIRLHSAAPDRATYLQRPDLGRILDESSRNTLAGFALASAGVVFVVADGLSALAVERHAAALLAEVLARLACFTLAPICVVEQGRVAIGDEIGSAFGADLGVVLIGERPGLSSPDSLGAYITWQPRPGRTDAERNCISNIRIEGLNHSDAAGQLVHYLTAARQSRLTGTALETQTRTLPESQETGGRP